MVTAGIITTTIMITGTTTIIMTITRRSAM